MNIRKLGHCCLVIKVKGLTVLTDPGEYSTGQNNVQNIDIILITHEHPDHLHIESLKTVLANNPQAKVITNTAVGKILDTEKIPYTIVGHLQNIAIKEVLIEGYGEKHAGVYPSIVPVENTGYFINNEFFYPGDAFYNPQKSVRILALPVAGPWMKLAEAIDFAKAIKPEYCFPVHDGMLKFLGPVHKLPEKELQVEGVKFVVLKEGDVKEFF